MANSYNNPITDEAIGILSGKPNSNGRAEMPSLARLLEEIEQYICRYLVLPKIAYLPLALWAAATHASSLFDCFPYIAVISAVKRCGKTRVAEVLEMVVRQPWRGTMPSSAALYRLLCAGTLLLDETEPLNAKNKSEATQNLLGVLNAGYRKGGTVPRCAGQSQVPRFFPVYGPKFFAAIGRLPDTLMDRSIVIHMKRRKKKDTVGRFLQKRAKAEARPLYDSLKQFAQTHRDEIDQAYQSHADLEYLNDRDAELWIPLFTMCSLISPERTEELRTCARELSGTKIEDDADDSYSLTLLRDLRAVWPESTDKYETSLLIDKLKALEESPWSEHQLTPRKLARMLKPFDVGPKTIRIGERLAKGYIWSELEELFTLYLENLSVTSGTSF